MWYDFFIKIKPNGKAFRSICYSKIFYEVLANAVKFVQDYAIYAINDQVWYTNSNFDPEPWEARYEITPPDGASIEERSTYVRAYMSYPQYKNRLSKDYIKNTLIGLGYANIDVEYNSTGAKVGFLHANDFANEKLYFNMGSLTYNSFILSGTCLTEEYPRVINMAMSLKPLQVAIYDKVEVYHTVALDDSLAVALDVPLAITLTTI